MQWRKLLSPACTVHTYLFISYSFVWRKTPISCSVVCDVHFFLSGQWNVWHRASARAWDQQYGGGERTALLYLPETRHQLLHDVCSWHHCYFRQSNTVCRWTMHIPYFLPFLLSLTVDVITAMSGSMATAFISLRRWQRQSGNGTAWDAEVMGIYFLRHTI